MLDGHVALTMRVNAKHLAAAVSLTLLLATWAAAPADARCPSGYSVSPGVGSTIITILRAHNVGCGTANRVVERFECRLPDRQRVRAGGRTFTCRRKHRGSRDSGKSIVRCRSGGHRVQWHANYGI